MDTAHSTNVSTLPELVDRRHILAPALPLKELSKRFEFLPAWPDDLSSYTLEQLMDLPARIERILLPLESDLRIHHAVRQSLIAGYSIRDPLSPSFVAQYADEELLQAPQLHQGTQLGFTLIGPSGSGKTTAMRAALSAAVPVRCVPFDDGAAPGGVGCRIGYLYLECPHDGHRIGIVQSFFTQLDTALGHNPAAVPRDHRSVETKIHEMAMRILSNDVGILVIDEIQRVFQSHKGYGEDPQLVMNFLTSLVNSLQIPIAFVGTPDAVPYFEKEPYLNRRMKGMGMLHIGPLPDEEFCRFVSRLERYQLTPARTPVDAALTEAFAEATEQFPGRTVQLWRQAQDDALVRRLSRITPESVKATYKRSFAPSTAAYDTDSEQASSSTAGTACHSDAHGAPASSGSSRRRCSKASRANMEQVAHMLTEHGLSRTQALAVAQRAVDAAGFGAGIAEITYEALGMLLRKQTST